MPSLRILAAGLLLLGALSTTTTLAADASVGEVVDQVINALNTHDYDSIEPLLDEDYAYSRYQGAMARTILRQVVTQYSPAIVRYELAGIVEQADHLRAQVVLYLADESTEEHTILISREMRLLRADVASIQLAPHGPEPAPAPANSKTNDKVPDVMEIPFTLADRLITVEAEVNGQRGRFLIDSGATGALTLSASRFPELANAGRAVEQAYFGASGSIEQVRTNVVDLFRWQDMEFYDLEATLFNLDHLERATGIDRLFGLIGSAMLENFQVDYDYSEKTLTLLRLDGEGEPFAEALQACRTTVPVERMFHIPVIEAEIGGQVLRFGIDSGAEGSMLQTRWEQPLQDSYEFLGWTEFTGADLNSQRGKSVRFDSVVFSGLSYGDMDFQISEPKFNHKVQIDGLIGYDFLSRRRTGINLRKKELYLDCEEAADTISAP
jgi:hypothetical protein